MTTLHRVVLVAVASCHASATTVTVPEPQVTASASAASSATPTAPPETDVAIAKRVLDRWNEAHARHDADALRALYAPSVAFYSARLSADECAKRKAAAFARAPDYAQQTKNVTFVPDGNGGVFVEFAKTSASHGASATTDGYLYVEEGHVTAEGDGGETPTVRWDWCIHDTPLGSEGFIGFPRDEAIGGFKIAPLDAVSSTARSRHVAEVRARHHDVRLKVVIAGQTGCPALCAMFDPRGPMADPPCENKQGEYGLAIVDAATGNAIENVQVDAMTNVLRWPGGEEPPR